MRIGVLGAGALGSLFAGLLAARGRAEPVLFAREGAHAAAVRERGLRVVRPDGNAVRADLSVVTDPANAPACDAVLVCVKSYDTADAVRTWRPALNATDGSGDRAATATEARVADVCTLQNGLGNAETLTEFVPGRAVLAGTTSHGATREDPGVVRHAGAGDTRLGRWVGPNDDAVEALAAALTAAGVETAVTADPRAAVWRKVLVNVGINAPTALARVENGRVADAESGRRVARRAVVEAARVARAEGVAVGRGSVAETLRVATHTARNRSSMREDVEAGRRTEVEALHGAVVARADEHDLPAPVNRTLADLVRLAQGDSDGSSGTPGPGDSADRSAPSESDRGGASDGDADADTSGRGQP